MGIRNFGLAAAALAMAGMPNVADAADLVAKAEPLAVKPASPILYQDTTIGYLYEPDGRNPTSPISIPKQVVEMTHIQTWTYGTNFFAVQLLKSSSIDPAAPSRTPGVGDGALEVYGLYRGTLSGNGVTGTKMFSAGPIRDLSLIYGFDIETKNNFFAAQKRAVVGGVQVAFAVPGYLTVAVNAYQEWNHNGVAQDLISRGLLPVTNVVDAGGKITYNTTAEFEIAYMQPLAFTGLPLKFQGFTNFILPKGNDAYGAATVTEIYSVNRLILDVSKTLNLPGLQTDVFVGYKYWGNKFGGDSKIYSNSNESQVFTGIQVHI